MQTFTFPYQDVETEHRWIVSQKVQELRRLGYTVRVRENPDELQTVVTATVTRVVLVGRHTPKDLPAGVEVIEQQNVEFALSVGECTKQLHSLEERASLNNAAILFQNTPTILSVVLVRQMAEIASGAPVPNIPKAVIISVPGPRLAGVEEVFTFNDLYSDAHDAQRAVLFANSRAKTHLDMGVLTVTVDPVSPFVFSHIEWF